MDTTLDLQSDCGLVMKKRQEFLQPKMPICVVLLDKKYFIYFITFH